MVVKHVTCYVPAKSQETVILATISELPRLDVSYLAVNMLVCVLTLKHVWEVAGEWCEVVESLKHGAEMHPTVSLSTALVTVTSVGC